MSSIYPVRVAVIGLLLLLLPLITLAGPIVRSGESVSVEADQILEGDFYGAGNTVSISGEAKHDVYVGGGSVKINAPVAADLVVLGGTVHVDGTVGDDLRVVGGEVNVAERVEGDVVVVGGVLKILSTAEILGDVLFLAGEVDINGNVEGTVAGSADVVRIDARVGGHVDVIADKALTLGDRADIQGNLTYQSSEDVARAQGAVVVGEVIKSDTGAKESDRGTYVVLPLLMVLFAALTFYLLFRRQLQEVTNETMRAYGMNGLIGLGVFVTVPVASVLLMVSVLGLIPGIILLTGYTLVLLVTLAVSGVVLGTLVLQPFTNSGKVSLLSTIVGVALMCIASVIPFVGPLFILLVFLIVLGGITHTLWRLF